MASTYVLSNYQLQYLADTVPSRFRLYFGVLQQQPFVVTSTDLLLDTQGVPTAANDVDLLATHHAPYAPQPNLGSNRIGFAGEALFFDGARSTQRGNLPASSHNWSFSGTPSVTYYNGPYTQQSQVAATWSLPGLYTVRLTVTDRFGGSTTGMRQVLIYADRASVPNGPYGLSSISGSIAGGGWSMSTSSAASLGLPPPASVPIGTYIPVVLLHETEYEVTPGNWQRVDVAPYGGVVPGQFYRDPRVLFSGYLESSSAAEDDSKDTVSYTFRTAEMIAQACGVHNIGYYNTSYATRAANGVPLTLKTNPPLGHGQLVADLASEDIYRSLFIDHSTLGNYHDVIIWRDYLPQTSGIFGSVQSYWLTYSNLTAPEGSVWDALLALAQNEYAQIWCDSDSSFCIGPTLGMRGYELLTTPTAYGTFALAKILNLSSEASSGAGALASTIANWPSTNAYLHFLWGPAALPQPVDTGPATHVVRDVSALLGPPILLHLADVPVYDPAATAPSDPNLFPWVAANWPQDLSVRPLELDVNETYTGKQAFVKLTMTAPLQNTQWSAWYPTGLFAQNGTLLQTVPAGGWQVLGAGQTSVLPDVTIAGGTTQRTLVWAYLWEICRRLYFSQNSSYMLAATMPMAPYLRLGDLFQATRQRALDGPRFTAKPFQVQQITHSISLGEQMSFVTQLQGSEITTFGMGPMTTPPFSAPAN